MTEGDTVQIREGITEEHLFKVFLSGEVAKSFLHLPLKIREVSSESSISSHAGLTCPDVLVQRAPSVRCWLPINWLEPVSPHPLDP